MRTTLRCVISVVMASVALLAASPARAQGSSAFDHLGTGFPLTGAHQAARCESCHVRGVFRGTPRSCASCHTTNSRFSAVAMPATHIPVTQSCDACHNTVAFAGARFNHAGVRPGTCASCHNNRQAIGKPAGHVVTTASCDACHRTTSYTPAFFNHANVAAGTCLSCHAGTVKSTTHMQTSRSCDACHTTTAWLPPRTYTHLSPFYKPHNSGVTCRSCHSSNTEAATWTFAAYKPDCAGCHASRYRAGAHKKVDSPQILYTVAELKNCAGSCHTYTNSTFTTISRSRSGEHRSTAGGF